MRQILSDLFHAGLGLTKLKREDIDKVFNELKSRGEVEEKDREYIHKADAQKKSVTETKIARTNKAGDSSTKNKDTAIMENKNSGEESIHMADKNSSLDHDEFEHY